MAAELEEGEWLWEGVIEEFGGGARSRGEDVGWPREGDSEGFVGGVRSCCSHGWSLCLLIDVSSSAMPQTVEVMAGVVVVIVSDAAAVEQLAISFLGARRRRGEVAVAVTLGGTAAAAQMAISFLGACRRRGEVGDYTWTR